MTIFSEPMVIRCCQIDLFDKIYMRILTVTISILLLTSCRLTKNNVIGKWADPSGATLTIKSDNSFILYKNSSTVQTQPGRDSSSFLHVGGHWILSARQIYFEFTDTTQHLGSGCRSYSYWRKAGKKTLVRPVTCESPTHRFVTVRKID